MYHAKLQHKVQQHETSTQAAGYFMQNFVKVITAENADHMLREYQLHRQGVISRLRLEESSCASFVFVNWLAPSTLKSACQSSQTQFAAHCILSSEANSGAVLMPIFTYKKGQLWMLETATLRSLAMTGLNVDHAWHLCFGKKASWCALRINYFYSPNSVSTLWGSYGKGKEWCP